MSFRFPAILFVLILTLGVALLIISLTSSDTEKSGDLLMEELAKVQADEITSVEIQREDGSKLSFTKIDKDRWDEEWEVAEPGGGKRELKAKADPRSVMNVIDALLKAKATSSSLLTGNPALHGLNPPSLHVTLRQGNERSSTINFGDLTSGGNAVAFVTTSARPDRPLATPRSGVEALFRTSGGVVQAGNDVKWANDYRVKTLLGADVRGAGDDVDELVLVYKGKRLDIEKNGGAWKFVQPAGWGEIDPTGDLTANPGTFTGARPLLGAITSIQAISAADFVDAPSKEQLEKDGLNPGNPDIIKVEVKTRDKGVSTILIGKRDTPAAAPPSPGMPSPGKVWVKVEGEPGIVLANAGDLSGLRSVIENPDPLRDRTLLAIEKDKIDGLDITTGSQTTKLRKAGAVPEWKLYGNPAAGDPQPADPSIVNKLLDVLTERRTIRGFPPPNPSNFTPQEIKAEVKIWASGFEAATDPKAEPQERGKPITLLFGKKEGDSIYVRRTLPDGSSNEFLMPDKVKLGNSPETVELIPTVAVNRLDLLEKGLKTFAASVANKIAVTGVNSYELAKEEQKDSAFNKEFWSFASPPDQKGKTADYNTVEQMLAALGTTRSVVRYVDEAPTPAKLAEYGLASPRLKVVVGLKGTEDAEKERAYEFGNPTGEFVYARVPGKNAVFTLPKSLFDRFADADLRNREIFQFDPAKVVGLEVEGWGGNGFLTKLNFEKKDGTWKAIPPSPAGYSVDPRKIEQFLTTLRTTNVKTFLPGTPTGEQGFGDNKQKLVIVLKYASGPVVSLNIGAPADGGAAYFVWTSVLPQTAPDFTVDASRFKMYKESPGVFAK